MTLGDIAAGFGMPVWALLLFLLWSLLWKAAGLWVSARGNQKWWFITILILNTAGILEAIYLFIIKKGKWPAEVEVDRIPRP